MSINLHLPNKPEMLRPTITVVGVGGAGGNAVNNMITSNLEGVSFVAANTDAQALENSLAERRIQLGANITRGLGAGAAPEVGRAAAEEAIDEINAAISGSNMVFITAGMGGGTGTGAAPVVARLARDQGILTVGVITKPFQFEGTYRMRLAESGIQELQNYVDTLIIIPNQNLFRIANEHTTFADAFKMADEVLHSGVRGVTDLMIMPGLINLDFADIRAVMREMGKAMMGTGEAEGPRRAIEAAEAAISNPLLDEVSMKGARGVLINITGGPDMTLFEVDEAANRIREEVDPEANIIFGSTFNDGMQGKMRVSVVSTGIDIQSSISSAPRATTTTTTEQKRPFSYTPAPRVETRSPAPRPAIELPKEVMRSSAVQDRPQEFKAPAAEAPRAPEPRIEPKVAEAPKPAPVAAPVASNASQEAPAQRPLKFAPAPQTAQQELSYGDDLLSYEQPKESAKTETAQRSFVETGLRTAIGVASYVGPTPTPVQAAPVMAQHTQTAEAVAVSHAQQTAPVMQSLLEPVVQSNAQAAPKADIQRNFPGISPRQEASREPAPEKTEGVGRTLSLFQKVVGIGKTLSRSEEVAEPRPTAVVRTTESKPLETTGVTKTPEEEYLDIPAFLRRQAN